MLVGRTLLFLFSMGIIVSFRKAGLAGWVPLFYWGSYQLGNAVALTSGSRYSSPVDWVILLYMSMGFFAVLGFSLLVPQQEKQQNNTLDDLKPFQLKPVSITLVWLVFFLIGLMMPLSSVIFPKKYAHPEELDSLSSISSQFQNELLAYQQKDDVDMYEGRLIWPMFYKNHEDNYWGPDKLKDIDRMIFFLICQIEADILLCHWHWVIGRVSSWVGKM